MGGEANYDWRAAAASALEWWADAGVDVLVEDAPRDWLGTAGRVAEAPSPAASLSPASALPDTLEAFLAWRGGEHAPEAGWGGTTVLASGPTDADLMVLADLPDREDCAAGQLLTGAAGRLFDRMLAAIGLSRERVHLVSVCIRRPAAGRVGREDERLLGEVARRHVELVAPKHLLLLGNAATRAVLGTDVAHARGGLRPINHGGGQTGAVASFHPRFLLERPAAKAEAWRDLQLIGDGT